MNALAELCREYPNKDERLLAASSLIVKLEAIITASDAVINSKQKEIQVLKETVESLLRLLRESRFLYPADILPHLDNIIFYSGKALVYKS